MSGSWSLSTSISEVRHAEQKLFSPQHSSTWVCEPERLANLHYWIWLVHKSSIQRLNILLTIPQMLRPPSICLHTDPSLHLIIRTLLILQIACNGFCKSLLDPQRYFLLSSICPTIYLTVVQTNIMKLNN